MGPAGDRDKLASPAGPQRGAAKLPHGRRDREARVPGRARRARWLGALLGLVLAACSDAGTREAAIGAAAAALAADAAMQAPALPRLRTSLPAEGAIDVPRDEWLRLEFEHALGGGAERGGCALLRRRAARRRASPRSVRSALVLNPDPALPAAAACELRWPGEDGPQRLRFATAGAGVPVFVRYDRGDSRATAPFPDDFWLRPGSDGDPGERLAIDLSGFREPSQSLVSAFVAGAQGLDGFSPIAHLTVDLSEAPDLASLPRTPPESLDPLASVGLFDLTPGLAEPTAIACHSGSKRAAMRWDRVRRATRCCSIPRGRSRRAGATGSSSRGGHGRRRRAPSSRRRSSRGPSRRGPARARIRRSRGLVCSRTRSWVRSRSPRGRRSRAKTWRSRCASACARHGRSRAICSRSARRSSRRRRRRSSSSVWRPRAARRPWREARWRRSSPGPGRRRTSAMERGTSRAIPWTVARCERARGRSVSCSPCRAGRYRVPSR